MGNLQNLKINTYLKGASQYGLGLDYLRFNFKRPIFYFESKIRLLNNTNSHFFIDGDYTFTKYQTPTGWSLKCDTSFNGVSVPLFFYCQLNPNFINPLKKPNESDKPYARLDYYGSFYRLQEIGHIDENFIQEFISKETNEDPRITRIDYKIDLFYKDHIDFPLYSDFFSSLNRNTKIQVFQTGLEKIESWSVGSKSAKRYFIRMYNKLIDINKKQKMFLYSDYFKFKQVYRFEIQFQASFTRGYKLSTLNWLIEKCKNAINIKTLLPAGHETLFYKYSKSNDINDFSKSYYTKQFVNKGEKFALSGYNPYLILHEGLQTKETIDKDTYKKYLQDFKKII